MTLTTLVTGSRASEREAAIAAKTAPGEPTAVILEGLPDGNSPLDALRQQAGIQLSLVRIAPGCPCCIGNLAMRVTLNRLLRRAPSRLYIGLASSSHLEQVRAFLTQPPYPALLALTEDWHV
jgi:hypothetical protein